MNPGAMSLAVDAHNNVWIGMGASGVVRMDGFNEMTEFTSSDPWLGFNDQIEGADFDPQGSGWFASCGTPGSYSTYTLPGSSASIITPDDGGILYSPDRRVKVSIPGGAVGMNTQVTITPANPPPVEPRQPLYIMDLTAVEEGTANPVTTFTTPYDLDVVYTEVQRGVISEASLGFYTWDGLSWVLEPTSTVDESSNLVSAQLNHMSYFGVLGESQDLWLPLITR
jgi:hypothetical protein